MVRRKDSEIDPATQLDAYKAIEQRLSEVVFVDRQGIVS
jgi:hypothetical protein